MDSASPIRQRLLAYGQLMRLDRPVGTLLLMWPTLWALLHASGAKPDPWVLFVMLLGVLVMRSAGCVINDFADRNIDGQVKRTQQRPLVTGQASPEEAIGLFALLGVVAFALVLTLNELTIYLSFMGIVLAFLYPFMKRFTHLPQLVLGVAFSWSIPMAYAAQSGAVPASATLLFVANIAWTFAYDTEYAMVDRDDDQRIGVKSSAILLGRFDIAGIAILQSVALLCLALFGWVEHLNWAFYLSLTVVAGLFSIQLVQIRARERQACFKAFLDNNRVGLCITLGLLGAILIG